MQSVSILDQQREFKSVRSMGVGAASTKTWRPKNCSSKATIKGTNIAKEESVANGVLKECEGEPQNKASTTKRLVRVRRERGGGKKGRLLGGEDNKAMPSAKINLCCMAGFVALGSSAVPEALFLTSSTLSRPAQQAF